MAGADSFEDQQVDRWNSYPVGELPGRPIETSVLPDVPGGQRANEVVAQTTPQLEKTLIPTVIRVVEVYDVDGHTLVT